MMPDPEVREAQPPHPVPGVPVTDIDPLKLLIETGLLTAFAGAVVFVAGWSYADRFMAELGLNLSAIEGGERENMFGYAYWVLRDSWLPILVSALILALVGLLMGTFRRPGAGRRLDVAVILAVLAAGGLGGAAALGSARASRQVPALLAEGFHNFPRIIVVAKKDSELAAFLADRGQLGKSTCLRKLFMDRRNLYGYAGYNSLRGQRPNVFILPLSEIVAIQVVNNPGLCDP